MIPKATTSTGPAFPNSGVYILLLEIETPMALRIGALGTFTLPTGTYLYTGSARRGMRARVARHLSPDKALRWHIDYLTTAPGTSRVGAVAFPVGFPGGFGERTLSECGLNRRAGALAGQAAPVPGFGASDCRAGCPAHLWYTGSHLSLDDLTGLEAAPAHPFRFDPPRRQTFGPGHHR
ncbi:MAG: GIY-YIG nuclease family protein [bacterium]